MRCVNTNTHQNIDATNRLLPLARYTAIVACLIAGCGGQDPSQQERQIATPGSQGEVCYVYSGEMVAEAGAWHGSWSDYLKPWKKNPEHHMEMSFSRPRTGAQKVHLMAFKSHPRNARNGPNASLLISSDATCGPDGEPRKLSPNQKFVATVATKRRNDSTRRLSVQDLYLDAEECKSSGAMVREFEVNGIWTRVTLVCECFELSSTGEYSWNVPVNRVRDGVFAGLDHADNATVPISNQSPNGRVTIGPPSPHEGQRFNEWGLVLQGNEMVVGPLDDINRFYIFDRHTCGNTNY